MENKNLITTSTGVWEIVIGLEVHAQVLSQAKLFEGSSAAFGGAPNSHVSFLSAGLPGSLPHINKFCVEQSIKTGLGLNATINLFSKFDRKNYFYPDLPLGYQISQLYFPIVEKGFLDIETSEGSKRIRINRLHIEQDAGKSLHDQHPQYTFIDLNRAGVALMEIVSEPDIRSAEEAISYLKKLRTILRYLGTCDGNMEEGSLRADVNISVRRPGGELGTRCEVKNVNSMKFIGQAIAYEVKRQIDLIESGGSVLQETRLFDAASGVTRSMRSKEDAFDYRYFPEPDLPALVIDESWLEAIKKDMPELPDSKKERYIREYQLSSYDAEVIIAERDTAEFYESACAGGDSKNGRNKIIANWLAGEVFAALNRDNLTIKESKISPKQLGQLVDLILDDTISGKIAKEVFEKVWQSGMDPAEVVEKEGLKQVTDTKAIGEAIDRILAGESEKVAEYRSGKDKLLGYFVGLVMKEMKGKANPKALNDILLDKLKG